ncbi:MAG: TIGR03621 family F420-dependent LLM class oxidoreductase [Chloroflexi bacterium]|nr:TIGR03621 family F420-dependent LLM class oxidoreductase [Chloroflexota bacterium]
MATPHPFHFSANLDSAHPARSQNLLLADEHFSPGAMTRHGWSREGLVAKARWIEDLGYTALLAPDHPWLDIAPMPVLMLIAETTSLRIGSQILNVDIRHPALLAKDIAMLDVLSNGRFECGLGCGAFVQDYSMVGMPFDRHPVRASRFEESVQLIKRFFVEETVEFSGHYYQITDLPGYPKPLQRPYPPLYIGGGGKRMLSIAAREADKVGLMARATAKGIDWASATHEATLEKIAWIREAAGARFEHLELDTTLFVVIHTEDRVGTAQQLASRWGLTPEQLLSCIHMLIGTTEQMVEDLQWRRQAYGISSVRVIEAAAEAFAPVVAQLTGK